MEFIIKGNHGEGIASVLGTTVLKYAQRYGIKLIGCEGQK